MIQWIIINKGLRFYNIINDYQHIKKNHFAINIRGGNVLNVIPSNDYFIFR